MDDDATDDPTEFTEPEREASDHSESIWLRLLWMLIIAAMISVAQTVLVLVTVVQFIIMLTAKGTPNERLADFGTGLGIWIAKAARFQAAASETRPWPWTDLD